MNTQHGLAADNAGTGDLSDLVNIDPESAISGLEALSDSGRLDPLQIGRLARIVERSSGSVSNKPRESCIIHKVAFGGWDAFDFSVHIPSQMTVRNFLHSKFGREEVERLVLEFQGSVLFDVHAPEKNEGILVSGFRPKGDDFKGQVDRLLFDTRRERADLTQTLVIASDVLKRAHDRGLDVTRSPEYWNRKQGTELKSLHPGEIALLVTLHGPGVSVKFDCIGLNHTGGLIRRTFDFQSIPMATVP